MTSDSLTTRPDGQSGGTERDLLELYLAGKLSADAAERVERWLDMNVPARRVVEAFRDGVTEVDVVVPDAHRMVERLGAKRQGVGQRQGRARWVFFKGQPLRQGIWYAIAGATLALLIVMAGWHIGPHRGGRGERAFSTYTTGNGERAKITLPDGNTILLNVASQLEVPADYLAGDHALRLNGEALFVVQHREGNPLTVKAGQTTTRVLGTTFAVRHYTTDVVTTVAVRDGKVATNSAVVIANQMIEVPRAGEVKFRPATPAQFSFETGTLTLDELRLPEAILELDRWYDVDIRLGDPRLASRGVVAGKFAASSLAALAMNLELALDVRVVRDGRVLTLYPRS